MSHPGGQVFGTNGCYGEAVPDREQRPHLGRRNFLRQGLHGVAGLGAAALTLRCAPASASDEVLLEEAKS